jgi:hypothetical protein
VQRNETLLKFPVTFKLTTKKSEHAILNKSFTVFGKDDLTFFHAEMKNGTKKDTICQISFVCVPFANSPLIDVRPTFFLYCHVLLQVPLSN